MQPFPVEQPRWQCAAVKELATVATAAVVGAVRLETGCRSQPPGSAESAVVVAAAVGGGRAVE